VGDRLPFVCLLQAALDLGQEAKLLNCMIFEDNNFDTDPAQRWMVLQEVIPVNPADPITGWTNTVQWEMSGGDPGGYRLMEHDNTAATDDFVQIFVYHLYTAARYEPSTQGAIQSVSYQIDGIKRGPSGPAEIAGGTGYIE
jgi:hypothetical protein